METQNSTSVLPQHWFKRFSFALAGIIIPPLCFWLGDTMKPEWQGDENAFAKLFFMPEVNYIFYPLLAYSILCLALLFWDEEETASIFWTRLGVYGGFFLALFFVGATFPEMAMAYLIGGVPSILLWFGVAYLVEQAGEKGIQYVSIFVTLFIILSVFFLPMLGGVGIIALLLDPFWCLCLYGWLSFHLFMRYEMQENELLLRIVGALGWSAGFGMAWRISYLKALEEYQKLPEVAPDCYIATAATQGHLKIVHTRQTMLQNGKTFRFNPQLQRLKVVEVALKTAFPSVHLYLRKVYNSIGKPMAKRLNTPFRADIAYFLLKPFEWIFYGMLCLLMPKLKDETRKIYYGNVE